jgi:hypothetical protein
MTQWPFSRLPQSLPSQFAPIGAARIVGENVPGNFETCWNCFNNGPEIT